MKVESLSFLGLMEIHLKLYQVELEILIDEKIAVSESKSQQSCFVVLYRGKHSP